MDRPIFDDKKVAKLVYIFSQIEQKPWIKNLYNLRNQQEKISPNLQNISSNNKVMKPYNYAKQLEKLNEISIYFLAD